MSNDKWLIRDAQKTDIEFIYATWLNSYHYDSWCKQTRKSIFYSNYKQIIDSILLNSTVSIACLPSDANIILGYLVSEPKLNTAHYSFIKEPFRRMGILKSLYAYNFHPDDEINITHCTKTFKEILRNHKKLIYNPFILFNKE